jgi:hypothetical protein
MIFPSLTTKVVRKAGIPPNEIVPRGILDVSVIGAVRRSTASISAA